MAGIALFAGRNMTAGFIGLAGGDNAIVTTLADAQGFVVIDSSDRHPGRHCVTSSTHVTGQNMRGGFIAGDGAVVTGLAHPNRGDFVVVDSGNRCPRAAGVAGLADIGRVDMRCGRATGRGAVVTGDAGVRRGAVIEGRHRPVNRGVTNFTGLGGRYVSWANASRDHTVMTGRAATDDLVVIHCNSRHPTTGRCVTGVALIAGANVRRCRISLTRSNDAIVTTLTGALGFVVINRRRRHPGGGHVTGVTDITGENMCRTLARGDHPVMTGLTSTNDFVVVHGGCRCPHRSTVTNLAQVCGVDVRCRLTTCRYPVVTGDTGFAGGAVIKGGHRPVHGGVTDLAGLGSYYVSRRLADSDHPVMTGFASTDNLVVIHQRYRQPTHR